MRIRILSILLLFSVAANSQNLYKLDQLDKGNQAFNTLQYYPAALNYENFLRGIVPDSFSDVTLKLAETYWRMRDGLRTFRTYKLLRSMRGWSEAHKIRFAELLARNEQYDSAAAVMYSLNKEWATLKGDGFKNKNVFLADSASWKIGFLNLNTGYSEFGPVIRDKTVLFNSNRRFDEKNTYLWDGAQAPHTWEIKDTALIRTGDQPETPERLYRKTVAQAFGLSDNDPLTKEKQIEEPTYLHHKYFLEGRFVNAERWEKERNNYSQTAPVFTNTNRIYFAATYQTQRRTTRLQLFEAEYDRRGVRYPHPLEFNDTAHTFIHPTITPNGKLLVFASDKKDSKGGFDLYYSLKIATGFSIPKKLEQVNTQMNEVFPYLSDDGWLYFSSDGLPGLGGLDIYRIKIDSVGNTSGIIQQLSYPINTGADDFGWAQFRGQKRGYFSSDRLGDDNIYAFQFVERPREFILRGSARSKNATFAAAVTLDDLSDASGQTSTTVIVSEKNPQFSIPLKENKKYRVTIRYKSTAPIVKYINTTDNNHSIIELGIIELF